MSSFAAGELIRQCAARRDPRAWEEFHGRFGARLRAGVLRALNRAGLRRADQELDDLVQDVYCRLLERDGRNLKRCRASGERAIGAYLGRVAETVAIDRLRAEAALKRGRDRLVRPAARFELDLTERAADPTPTPEQRLLARERRQLFVRRCREVVGRRAPERDFRVLCLAFLAGLSSREIARAVGQGLTPSSVDSLVHRARKRLAARGLEVPRRREQGFT